MRKGILDFRILFGLVMAHLLLYFSFQEKTVFWYLFSGSMLLLIIYSMFQEEVEDHAPFLTYLGFGILTGIILYGIFWTGYKGIELLQLPFYKDIQKLYHWYAPSILWEYLALALVAAPGEELFWRGFIQKRLLRYFRPTSSVILTAFLYATAQIYSGEFMLVLATFISGLIWGMLYHWKKSMPLVMVSHLIFDLLLFILFPLT